MTLQTYHNDSSLKIEYNPQNHKELFTLKNVGAVPAIEIEEAITYSDSDSIFFSKSGNDSTGAGTQASPYLTMLKAINSCSALKSQIVCLDSGIYSEDFSTASNLYFTGVNCATGQTPTYQARGVASHSNSDTIYVKKTGSDSNTGTQASPLLTIAHAITHCDGSHQKIGILDSETYNEYPFEFSGNFKQIFATEGQAPTVRIDREGLNTLTSFDVMFPPSLTNNLISNRSISLANGNIAVTYQDLLTSSHTYLQIMNDVGVAVTSQIDLGDIAGAGNLGTSGQMTILANDNFVVLYTLSGRSYFRIYDYSGNLIKSETVASAWSASYPAYDNAIMLLQNGNFIVLYNNDIGAGSGGFTIFTPGGEVVKRVEGYSTGPPETGWFYFSYRRIVCPLVLSDGNVYLYQRWTFNVGTGNYSCELAWMTQDGETLTYDYHTGLAYINFDGKKIAMDGYYFSIDNGNVYKSDSNYSYTQFTTVMTSPGAFLSKCIKLGQFLVFAGIDSAVLKFAVYTITGVQVKAVTAMYVYDWWTHGAPANFLLQAIRNNSEFIMGSDNFDGWNGATVSDYVLGTNPLEIQVPSHGMSTGTRFQIICTGGGSNNLPGEYSGGLVRSHDYYAVFKDANTVWLATSYANAMANTRIIYNGYDGHQGSQYVRWWLDLGYTKYFKVSDFATTGIKVSTASILDGITIDYDNQEGIVKGIHLASAGLTMRNCILKNLVAPTQNSNGTAELQKAYSIFGSYSVDIDNCIFQDNHYGVYVTSNAADIQNSAFYRILSGYGLYITGNGTGIVCEHNTFFSNYGGIRLVSNDGTEIIKNCIFHDNNIYEIYSNASIIIAYCINTGTNYNVTLGTATMSNNPLFRNEGAYDPDDIDLNIKMTDLNDPVSSPAYLLSDDNRNAGAYNVGLIGDITSWSSITIEKHTNLEFELQPVEKVINISKDGSADTSVTGWSQSFTLESTGMKNEDLENIIAMLICNSSEVRIYFEPVTNPNDYTLYKINYNKLKMSPNFYKLSRTGVQGVSVSFIRGYE